MNIRPVLIMSLDAFIGPLQDAVLMNKLWETDGQKINTHHADWSEGSTVLAKEDAS